MNTINLQATIDAVIELKGTINVSTNKHEGGAITSGFFIPCFIGGAKGYAGAPTTTKVLIDVNGYILKDNSGKVLTVVEGDTTWN